MADDQTPAEGGSGPADAEGVSGPAGERGEAPRAAGRRHWPAVTAVAAAVAVLAAALYGGSQLGGGDGGGAAGPEPLALDGYGTAASSAAVTEDAGPEIAALPVFYQAEGDLPAARGETAEAPVYDFSGSVDEARVAELADALGIPGAPEDRNGYWQVGSGQPDGGLSLTVTAEAPGEWYLTPYVFDHAEPALPESGIEPEPGLDQPGMPPVDDPVADGQPEGSVRPSSGPAEESPARPVGEPVGGSSGGSAEEPAAEPDRLDADSIDAPAPHPDPVSEKVALAAAAPVLERLGLAGAELDASLSWGDTRVVTVDAGPEGLPVQGWSTQLQVGPDGQLSGGRGALLEPSAGEEYPLIGADEALGLLNGGLTEAPEGARVVSVTGAELGLALHYSGGTPVLVPSWLYTVDEHWGEALAVASAGVQRISHPAVEPSLLQAPAGAGADDVDPNASVSSRGGLDGVVANDLTGKGGEVVGDSGTELDPDRGGLTFAEAGAEPYGAADTSLTYHYWGGVCGTYRVVADETADSVTLRVEHTSDGEEICILVAELLSDEVALESPVGDRTLLDEHGEEIPVLD